MQAFQKVVTCWKTVGDNLGDFIEVLNEDISDNDLERLINEYMADITDLRHHVQNIQDQFVECSQLTDKSKSVDALLTYWVDGVKQAA